MERAFVDTSAWFAYTDCTSFVLMRRLGLRLAIALDADFQKEGFSILPIL